MSNGQNTTKNGRKLYYPRTLSEQEVERQLTTLLHLAELVFGPHDLPTLKLYNDGQFSLVRLPQPMHTRDFRVIVHGQGIKNAKVAELFMWVGEERGSVLDMFRPADARFMFVQFANRHAFEAVLNRTGLIRGRAVTVQVAERKRSGATGSNRGSGRNTPQPDFEENGGNGGNGANGPNMAGVGEGVMYFSPEPTMSNQVQQLQMQHLHQMQQLQMQLQQMQLQGLLEPTMMVPVPMAMMPMMHSIVPTVPMVGPMGPSVVMQNTMPTIPTNMASVPSVSPTPIIMAATPSPTIWWLQQQPVVMAANNFGNARNKANTALAGSSFSAMPVRPTGNNSPANKGKKNVGGNFSATPIATTTPNRASTPPEMNDVERELEQVGTQADGQPGLGWIKDLLEQIPANQKQ